jgi:hypothetical protein
MRSPTNKAAGFEHQEVGSPIQKINRYFLFVIAVDNYQNGLAKLSNPVRDANSIVKLLLEKYRFNNENLAGSKLPGYDESVIEYDSLEVKCLYNEHATRDNIFAHIKKLVTDADGVKKDDGLLVYFSGHGEKDTASNGYIFPFSADINNDATWLRIDDLYAKFRKYSHVQKCMDLLLVLDCCYAGVATNGLKNIDNAAAFSRYALVSSSIHQQADDGEPAEGSPFAIAFHSLLSSNGAGYMVIDKIKLQELFNQKYEQMLDRQPEQIIQYEPLDECGSRHFVFELRDKDTPPFDKLTNSFVEHLNCAAQRQHVGKRFAKAGNIDCCIIVTRESNKFVHEFLRRVLFQQMADIDEVYNPATRLKTASSKSLPLDVQGKFDIWEILCRSYSTQDIKEEPVTGANVMEIILGQLLEKPKIISLYSESMTKGLTENILSFCREFVEKITYAKAKRAGNGEVYQPLFFIIPDYRKSNNDFFREEEIVQMLGSNCKVIVNEPVELLDKASATVWFKIISKLIPSENIKRLSPTDFFPQPTDEYFILDFMYKVCEKVKVDKTLVETAILNY